MEGEGMFAVVRGLKDSGLAVTLLDSGRQFTLHPESFTHPLPQKTLSHTIGSQCGTLCPKRESATQATDGRYTSTYKLMHCQLIPTSPPEHVTEFPPQRADVYPGHGNFVVGGQGSGESYCYPTRSSGFKGAMCWPDRSSVFSPRPSHQPDSFATSLRKYPNLSPDRSSEIVERLINFTQAKNSSKNHRTTPNNRNLDSDISNQTFCLDGNSSRHTSPGKPRKGYESEATITPKRQHEEPTRDQPKGVSPEPMESWRQPTFCKTNDVRYLRELSRKVREGIRCLSTQHDNRPERISRKRFDTPEGHTKANSKWCTNTVNMEIQATVQMISKDVITVPRVKPSQRSVGDYNAKKIAVPLTPKSSNTEMRAEERDLGSFSFNEHDNINETADSKTRLDFIDIAVGASPSTDGVRKIRRHKSRRQSHSEENIRINDSQVTPCCLKSLPYRISYNKIKTNNIITDLANKFQDKLYSVYISDKMNVCKKIQLKNFKYCPSYSKVFRAEVSQYKVLNEEDLKDILEQWINLIPININDEFNLHKKRDLIYFELFEYLKEVPHTLLDQKTQNKLKCDLLDRLKRIPLKVKDNENIILNSLADILINKITRLRRKRWNVDVNDKSKNENIYNHLSNEFVPPTNAVLRKFIYKNLIKFLNKSNLNIHQILVEGVEEDLLDLIVKSMKDISNGHVYCIENDIAITLNNYGLPMQQGYYFAKILIKHFNDEFINNTTHVVQSHTLILLPRQKNICCKSVEKASISKIGPVEEGIIKNIANYIKEICQQIEEWLTDLGLQMHKIHNENLKQAINELAEDIVDRHKYLKMNPTNKVSEEAELEYLKYQIYKWISKFAGDDHLESVQHATELMNRIKCIPTPLLSNYKEYHEVNPKQIPNIPTIVNKQSKLELNVQDTSDIPEATIGFNQTTVPYSNIACSSNVIKVNKKLQNTNERINKGLDNCSTANVDGVDVTSKPFTSIFKQVMICEQSQCCQNKQDVLPSNVDVNNNELLEAEYEQFVKDWVKKIPIIAGNSLEEASLQKARLGLYNGLLKAVTKLNCEPTTYFNRFLYEDLLEDSVDDLLNCLPQSPELQSKRHLLKVEFIEKTIQTNDLLKENVEASFKNQLIKNITTNLKRQGITDSQDDDFVKLHENLQIIKIVDDYILFKRFESEDRVKSAVYRSKLMKDVENFVNYIKMSHPKELNDINILAYRDNIINNLQKVSIPSEKTIKLEADDIVLGIEVEQWYNDLPIIQNNDYKEQYKRKRQIDILTRKIKEYENKTSSDNDLRREVSTFLKNSPLKDGESININFMVDELINRLKNKIKHDTRHLAKRVVFQTPKDYEEFRQNVSICSSFTEIPKSEPTYVSQDNKMTNRTSVTEQELPSYKTFKEERPASSSFKHSTNDNWYTLQSTLSDGSAQTDNNRMYTPSPYVKSYSHRDQSIQNNLDNIITNSVPKFHKPRSYIDQEDTKGDRNVKQITGPSGYRSHKEDGYAMLDRQTTSNTKETNSNPPFLYSNNNTSLTRQYSDVKLVPKEVYKCSIDCQTIDKTKHANQDILKKETKISDATNTMMSDVSNKQPIFSSHRESQTVPFFSSKKQVKLALDEDYVKRRLSSDEEDDIPCRCIERYFKRIQKLKNSHEKFDGLPPCIPFILPYPYFI